MMHMWLRQIVRATDQSVIVIDCAIFVGVAAGVIMRYSGPEARYLAHVIGGAVCLSIILVAFLAVLVRSMRWEEPNNIEEGT
jgi:formate hydrogenlyase subunit 3/multisubunit Na+/H+ antiporter MnhD subunit